MPRALTKACLLTMLSLMTMRRIFPLLIFVVISGGTPSLAYGQEMDAPEASVKVVDAPDDVAIETRLTEIKDAVGGLETVTLSVQAGVVTLTGEVENSGSAAALVAIAERTEGVVFVENQLTESVQVSARLQPVTDKFQELGTTALQLMPLLLIAVAVVILFWLMGGWLSRRSGWLQRVGLSELGALLGKRVIRLIVTLIGLIIALEILNATALFSAVLGVAGVFGIAVGFAFRNIVENYLAGILLSARNPFRIGDVIQVGEFTGNVVRLTSRDTVLMTLDGNHLRIPNSVIITSSLTNYSLNPLRRFDFLVDITPDADLTEARQLAREVLQGMQGLLSEPAPQCLIHELGASTVVLKVLGWVDQRETDLFKARSEAIRLVKQAFDDAAIEMPEPTYRVRMGAQLSESEEEPTPQKESTESEQEQTDVSADRSIDKQVSEELATSDEQNLLKR